MFDVLHAGMALLALALAGPAPGTDEDPKPPSGPPETPGKPSPRADQPTAPRETSGAGDPQGASKTGARAPQASDEAPEDPFAAPAGDAQRVDMSPSTDLSRTWSYSEGKSGPEPRYVDMGPQRVAVTPNPIGFYSGVSVTAGGTVPPAVPETDASRGPVLTWTGYEPLPSGSRVFFQLTAPVEPTLTAEGLVLRVTLPGTSVNVKNNMRPLELRYHPTVVRRVHVRRRGSDTVAIIRLKRAAEPTLETVAADNGFHLVVLRFPE